MKTRCLLSYSTAIAALILMSSCSKTDDIGSNGALNLKAQIGKAATKAGGTSWSAGDAIGVFMVNNGTTTIAENAANKKYATTGTSSFTAVSGSEIFFPMDGSSVDFIAYYPYSSTISALTDSYSIDVSDQSTPASIDLLWAKADNAGTGYSKTAMTASLNFSHKLTRLIINIAAGTGMSGSLSGTSVTINNTNTTNTMSLTDGTLGTAASPADITPKTDTDGSSYSAILIPGSYQNFVMTFTKNGETFTWTPTNGLAFAAGTEYTYNITLDRTGVTIDGCTITPWSSGTGGTGSAW